VARPDSWLTSTVGLLAGAGLLAWGWTVRAAEETRPASDSPAAPHAGRGGPNFPVSWSAPKQVVVPMKIRNGLPTLPCSMNGHAVWMILDTGSQECVLEAGTARDAGVRMIAETQARVEVAGVSGNELARVGVPDSLEIGAWQVRGQPFVVRASSSPAAGLRWFSSAPPAFNILGMSVLRTMCSYVTVDYAHRQVIFGFGQTFQPAAAAVHQSFELREGLPFVKVAGDGEEWPALVDTGASSKMEIDPSVAELFRSRGKSRWVDATQFGLGKSNEASPRRFERFTLQSVDCLGRSWRNVDAMLVDNESKIGSGMYRAVRLTVDFTGSQIWLETPGAGRQ
jgi:predicted aspartyl protease